MRLSLLSMLFVLVPSVVLAQIESVTIPEGTEVRIRVDEKVSSGTSAEGDRFAIRLLDPIMSGTRLLVKDGATGYGEVTHAKKRGRMGAGGELNVRFSYLRIGDQRIRLRGQKGREGEGRVGSTVALTVLFGPLGLLKRGKDVEINPGTSFTAFLDQDVVVAVPTLIPAAAPPSQPISATLTPPVSVVAGEGQGSSPTTPTTPTPNSLPTQTTTPTSSPPSQ